jgi:hypothetical protein
MLEVLLLVYLGKSLGRILRAKGRSAGWYQALMVVAWIGGQIVGMLSGMMINGSDKVDGTVYIGSLLGGVLCVTAVFILAKALGPVGAEQIRGFEVVEKSSPQA